MKVSDVFSVEPNRGFYLNRIRMIQVIRNHYNCSLMDAKKVTDLFKDEVDRINKVMSNLDAAWNAGSPMSLSNEIRETERKLMVLRNREAAVLESIARRRETDSSDAITDL